MPYKFETDKIKLPEGADRRVKLSEQDRLNIKLMYDDGNISTYKLAELFGVSRRTIQFILDPEKRKANRERLIERGGSVIYYDKDKNTKAIREHRQYKKNILDKQ